MSQVRQSRNDQDFGLVYPASEALFDRQDKWMWSLILNLYRVLFGQALHTSTNICWSLWRKRARQQGNIPREWGIVVDYISMFECPNVKRKNKLLLFGRGEEITACHFRGNYALGKAYEFIFINFEVVRPRRKDPFVDSFKTKTLSFTPQSWFWIHRITKYDSFPENKRVVIVHCEFDHVKKFGELPMVIQIQKVFVFLSLGRGRESPHLSLFSW